MCVSECVYVCAQDIIYQIARRKVFTLKSTLLDKCEVLKIEPLIFYAFFQKQGFYALAWMQNAKYKNTNIKYKMHESQHNSFEKTVTTAAITIRTWCVHSKIEKKNNKKKYRNGSNSSSIHLHSQCRFIVKEWWMRKMASNLSKRDRAKVRPAGWLPASLKREHSEEVVIDVRGFANLPIADCQF